MPIGNTEFYVAGHEKHVIHIAPFQFSSYELKSFGCLKVSNCLSNGIKGKNLIFVRSIT